MRHAPLPTSFCALLLALSPSPGWSQAAAPGGSAPGAAGTSPRPGPVETAPLPAPSMPTGDAPRPAAPQAGGSPPAPAPVPPPTAQSTPAPGPSLPTGDAPQPAKPASPAPAASARSTLVPNQGDAANVDEVTLPAKPAAILTGKSSWEEGFATLKTSFKRIEDELAKAGIAPAGRPLAVFLQTDDTSFSYEAMIPIAQAPEGRTSLTPDIRLGRTPDGRALRFAHKGPYDDIDTTYETVTAYLDAKGVVVKDAFVEEYVTDLNEASDQNLEINIFALPR